MPRPLSLAVLAALVALAPAAGCTTNPAGRSQLSLLDRGTEDALGQQAYQEQLAQEERVTADPAYHGPVERIARRLAAVVEKGFDSVEPPGFQWEFVTVDDANTVNAWCLPGGKICVYTGIFPVCADENGLAAVIGHEIMHAVFRHGNERISQGMLANVGTSVLTEFIGGENAQAKQQIQAALGLGAQVGLLMPFSRKGETEADEYGLYAAARAGYDPQAGIQVWERMAKLSGDGKPPEILSTHPADETRIANMKRWMPRALEMYATSEKQPSRALPAPGRASVQARAAAPSGAVASSRAKLAQVEGRPAALLEIETRRAVYVETIHVKGPQGADFTLPVKSGLPAGQKRVLSVLGPSGRNVPTGTYIVTFVGREAGRDWKDTVQYDVR